MTTAAEVKKVRKELGDNIKTYNLIKDCIDGEESVKKKKTEYLPKPNDASGDSKACDERYSAYLLRAVYYNAVKPTRDALVGQLFLRPPKIKVPSVMEAMLDDINGDGLNIEQLIRQAANHVLPYGRCGFLSDFPRTGGQVTKADVANGVKPTVSFYSPWSIINWRVKKIKNKNHLVLLVLVEIVEDVNSNEYEVELVKNYRVYKRTESGEVTVELWGEEEIIEKPTTVNDSDGKPLTQIPFEFVGADNNDTVIDPPPLAPMAYLNIAHFRNSADYEESVFMLGQPTPVSTGLTEDWVDNYFGGGVPLGSRSWIPLPVDADAKLLQVQPNTMAFEAMKHKEDQMVSVGAKLINPKNGVERKEAEIQIEAASQQSVLKTIRDNLQNAFTSALVTASKFVKTDDSEIEVELNDNFDLTSLTGEEIRWLLEAFEKKGISYQTLHENFRRSGFVKSTPEEEQAAIVKDVEFIKSVTPEEPIKKENSNVEN